LPKTSTNWPKLLSTTCTTWYGPPDGHTYILYPICLINSCSWKLSYKYYASFRPTKIILIWEQSSKFFLSLPW
jgi:hypothetical protein